MEGNFQQAPVWACNGFIAALAPFIFITEEFSITRRHLLKFVPTHLCIGLGTIVTVRTSQIQLRTHMYCGANPGDRQIWNKVELSVQRSSDRINALYILW